MKGGSYFKVGSPPAHKYCGKAGERERKKNATANIESGEHLLRLTECSAGELIAFHSVALQQLTRLMKNAWSKIIPLFEPLTLGGRRKKTGGGGGGGGEEILLMKVHRFTPRRWCALSYRGVQWGDGGLLVAFAVPVG